MKEKPRCNICLNRVNECICEQECKIIDVYIGSDKEYMWQKGEDMGMDEDLCSYFKHCLSEVKVTLRVNLKTAEYEVLKYEE